MPFAADMPTTAARAVAAAKIEAALAKTRSAPPLLRSRRPTTPRAAEPHHLDIVYERTQVVSPRPEILKRQGVLAAQQRHPVADAFRLLRSQVLNELEARGGNAVAVCAADGSEGRTFVAVNLAVSIAGLFSRTAILVDLDLRRPSVHRFFGLRPEVGLADHLLDGEPLEACLINPAINRLVLLPQPRPVESSSELLASPRMSQLALELRARYPERIVIFNTPSLLAADDALTVMGFADGCLLVAQEGRTNRWAFLQAAELIGRERFLGTVLSDARWSKGSGHAY